MQVLILGGTVFLGRHLTEAALASGHDVTRFNRGQHNADLYPDHEKLRGDRDGGLDVLKGRTWDAVVDTCGYVPRLVRDSASRLADAVDHHTFISTLCLPRLPGARAREEAAVGRLDDETVEAVTGGSQGSYGPLKALCEQAAKAAMPGRVLRVRPGLIVGPYDPTDRFTYWPVRVAHGGEVLAPPTPQAPVQLIDARDLAAKCPEKTSVFSGRLCSDFLFVTDSVDRRNRC
jgi:2'-hydroxyisoflavone reductase